MSPFRVLLTPLLAAAFLTGCGSPDPARNLRPVSAADLLKLPGARACPENAAFVCVPLAVPLEHARPADPRITVTFAVRPATGPRYRGVLVYVEGGPGISGMDSLGFWEPVSRDIPAEYDLVFFDLRGAKRSGNLDCKKAAAAFFKGGLRAADVAEELALKAKARTFAEACVKEMGLPPETLRHYNSGEAAQDIEDIRRVLGDRPVTLYGVSYGTGLAQLYTALFPTRVRGLILDGTVDPSMSEMGWVTSQHVRIAEVLRRTFAECAKSAECARPFGAAVTGATILAAYDAAAASLQTKAVEVAYPLKSGGTSPRVFSRADLDTTTFNALDRPHLRYKLAAAIGAVHARGDYVPLQSLAYETAKVDPETAGPVGTGDVTDPSGSWGVSYAFGCNDYASETLGLGPAERETLYLEPARRLWSTNPRVLSPHHGNAPCAYWPVDPNGQRLSRLAALPPSVPLLVIGATGDATTNYEEGLMVARRSSNGHAVTYDGGQHALVANGVKCIDEAVAAFLSEGKLPSVFERRCAGDFISP